MKNLAAAALVTALLSLHPSPTPAHHLRPPSDDVTVQVLPDRGSAFLTIPHADRRKGGTRVTKQYLEARKGETYGIVITNSTPERVGVVVAVDGRNIITGERSDLRRDEQMYIIDARSTVRLDGWRTSRTEVHRFFFTDPEEAYSVTTFGDDSAIGVIAVAVFREKPRPRPLLRQQGKAPAAAPEATGPGRAASEAKVEDRAGTGFGDALHAPVVLVEFEPEQRAFRKTLVRYEWREALCRKGVLRCGQGPGNRLWDDEGYAPYPPGHRG